MSDDRDPPKLTLASSNDEAELRKQRELEALRWPTREMAANLLRVMRGAGKPWELPQQILDLSYFIEEAGKVSNAWGIWTVIEEELHAAFPRHADLDFDEGPDFTIARGSLQWLASTLLHQPAQQAAGQREIGEGIRETEALRERNRRRWEQESAAEALRCARSILRPRKAPAKKARPKAVPKPKPQPSVAEPEEPPRTTAEFMRKRRREMHEEE